MPGAFAGGIPEDGHGTGYQLEAAMSYYAVNPNVSFAVGGRYWRMETQGPTPISRINVVGFTASPQPVDWKIEIIRRLRAGLVQIRPLSDRRHFLI